MLNILLDRITQFYGKVKINNCLAWPLKGGDSGSDSRRPLVSDSPSITSPTYPPIMPLNSSHEPFLPMESQFIAYFESVHVILDDGIMAMGTKGGGRGNGEGGEGLGEGRVGRSVKDAKCTRTGAALLGAIILDTSRPARLDALKAILSFLTPGEVQAFLDAAISPEEEHVFDGLRLEGKDWL